MTGRPRVVYLDQNKWIELARALKHPSDYPPQYRLLAAITREIEAGRLVLPLTAANIYETHKINDPQRRHELAILQATASQGLVFRGRHRRLETELNDLWCALYERSPIAREPLWFLSEVFFEAYADWNDPRLTALPLTEAGVNVVRNDPARWLYEFLMVTPEDVRVAAIRKFSDGSEGLRQRIEERRRQHAGESLAMRRRIQSALLMINEYELILTFARRAGFAWKSIGDMGEANARRVIEDVPTYYVEREIALRLEAQARAVEENDFRDMQSFCAIIPYANEVVGEKQFVNLARQAKLDRKFGTILRTDILALAEGLGGLSA